LVNWAISNGTKFRRLFDVSVDVGFAVNPSVLPRTLMKLNYAYSDGDGNLIEFASGLEPNEETPSP
jgi:hypothetical protein